MDKHTEAIREALRFLDENYDALLEALQSGSVLGPIHSKNAPTALRKLRLYVEDAADRLAQNRVERSIL